MDNDKNKTIMWVIFYGFLFLLGSFLAYMAFSQYQKTAILLEKGIKTTATVINYIESEGDNNTLYNPVFEFVDKSMTTRNFESGISSYPPAYELGEKVKILYSRSNVKEVKTISFWGLYRGSVILFMIGAPFLIIGGSYLLYVLY